MKYKIMVASVVIFSAISGQVLAADKIQVPSVQEVMSTCSTPASPESRSFCIGYVTATYDTYVVTRNPKWNTPNICIRQPAPTRDQVISELVNWSNRHPEYSDEPAAGNVLRFFSERFPCWKIADK
jgi:hypothetical protein